MAESYVASYGATGSAEEALNPGSGDRSQTELQRNFMMMSVCFSINHGISTTQINVSSSLYGLQLSSVGNGLFFLAALISSLLLAVPATSALGPKRALVLGNALFCVYAGGFLGALHSAGASLAHVCWVLANVCGGVASGIVWPAQGAYFSTTATLLVKAASEAEGRGASREHTLAMLASTFSFVFLLLEVLIKLAFSGLQTLGWSPVWISWGCLALCMASAVSLTRLEDLKNLDDTSSEKTGSCARMLGAMSLWSNPLIWLLAPTNLLFGFSAAFMNGYVNLEYAAKETGGNTISFLGAVTCITAALCSPVLGYLSSSVGKGPLIALASCSFLFIPISLLTLGCCTGWHWWITSLYVAQGIGRAVYESTNRAVFAEVFHGPDLDNAFANQQLQSCFAFACSFFFQSQLSEKILLAIVTLLAAAAPIGYALLVCLRGNLAQECSDQRTPA